MVWVPKVNTSCAKKGVRGGRGRGTLAGAEANMAVKAESVRFGAEGETWGGYLCHPEQAKGPLPAVLVLQEAWGVDAHIEDVTRRFAAAGYAAFAPDLFAPGGKRTPALTAERLAETQAFLNAAGPAAFSDAKVREAELAKRPAEDAARITETLGAIMVNVGNLGAFVPAITAAARWLRTDCALSKGQRVASVGFCMGGGLSALLAVNDPELAAAVIFYGPSPALDKVDAIRCPVLGLYGGNDPRINAGVPTFAEAMKRGGKRFEHVTYEGVHHAFFNDGRPSYDVAASRDAFVRTLELFRRTLGAK
jgi:carboxymethylenebutenolidase